MYRPYKLGYSSSSGVPHEVDLRAQEEQPLHETFRPLGGSDNNATRARMLLEIGPEIMYYPRCLEPMYWSVDFLSPWTKPRSISNTYLASPLEVLDIWSLGRKVSVASLAAKIFIPIQQSRYRWGMYGETTGLLETVRSSQGVIAGATWRPKRRSLKCDHRQIEIILVDHFAQGTYFRAYARH
jgi:hypothetical protein